MISLCSFELERRSLVHCSRVVLASCHDAEWPAARPMSGPVLPLTLLAAVSGLLAASAPQLPGQLALPALGGEAGGSLVVTGNQPP